MEIAPSLQATYYNLKPAIPWRENWFWEALNQELFLLPRKFIAMNKV
jgi:hypothetical protein